MKPPALRIRLFRELELRYDGTVVPVPESARAASLLAYLLLHRQAPQSREHLAFLFWPESTEAQARTNLRHVLHHLRRALPGPDQFLDVATRTLQWRTDAPYWLDVAAFEELASLADAETGERRVAAMREAVALYAGDLLEDWYDEWLLRERERVRGRYLTLLEQLVSTLEACGDDALAIEYAERLLRHEPLREETYRLLMRLYGARGDRARALRVYHVCVTTFERELDVAPSAQTRAAYEALLPLEREGGDERRAERIGSAPLVGRIRERQQLANLWRASAGGHAQLVLLTGEPGVGKTRLVDELRRWCAHRGANVAVAHSYAAEGALAYAPIVAWLRSEDLARYRHLVSQSHRSDIARLLPELLAETPDLAAPEQLPEGDQRQRLFDALAAAILVSGQPLLLVADDLQWSGHETLQFLHYLLRTNSEACLLVAGTARREEIDPAHPLNDLVAGLQALEQCEEIEIDRLSRVETAALAGRLAGRSVHPSDAERLYLDTEGNPLFIVEAVRAGWIGGAAAGDWISPRVQSVIKSRLARLSEPARELVGAAATIGREFTADLLASASEADDGSLTSGLDELWRRRIIREQGIDTYDFTHDKIREVAYHALSPARRRLHHLRVARGLERLHGDDTGPVSGQLAAHYERAGATEQAITWYGHAAEVAQRLHANAEAVRLLDRGLDLLHTRPMTRERKVRELALLTALPGPLLAVEGYASSRLTEVQQRALGIARELGTELSPPLLRSMAVARLSSGDFDGARRFGEQLRTRGERDADEVLLVQSEYVLGIAAFWGGDIEAAGRHFEAAVGRYQPDHGPEHRQHYGHDPGVVCLTRLAHTLWFLGCAGAAIRMRDAALALSDDIGHPYSRAVVLVFSAMLSLELGDLDCLHACASTLSDRGAEPSAWHVQIVTEALNGYLDVLDGRTDAGIARIQRALDDPRGTEQEAPGMHAVVVRLLLESCVAAGNVTAGLEAVDRAFHAVGIHPWEAEVRRLRAEFLTVLGANGDEVEAEFGRALQVAHSRRARSLELRVAMSLLRHHLRYGDAESANAARDRLATLVPRVSDGVDTADLRAATALLSQS